MMDLVALKREKTFSVPAGHNSQVMETAKMPQH
jgi:hypothetical protein